MKNGSHSVKRFFKNQIVQWCIAIVIGFLLVNALLFLYERPVGWYDTPNGVTKAVRKPGSLLIHGTEGFSVSRVDKNGFLNSNDELSDNYILISGSSHTQAKEVQPEKRYSEIVNEYFSDGSGRAAAYSIACDGAFLPHQIRYFQSAVSQYPDAAVYLMEIGSASYSPEKIQNALDQVKYDPADSAAHFAALSLKDRVKIFIKESFPLISMIQLQAETFLTDLGSDAEMPDEVISADPGSEAETPALDISAYAAAADSALALLRSETDKPIVILYHPKTTIEPDGSLILRDDPMWETFFEKCVDNGIDVIDCGEAFLENYAENHTVPYGFANTLPSQGHLNETGHRIVGEMVIEYMQERSADR